MLRDVAIVTSYLCMLSLLSLLPVACCCCLLLLQLLAGSCRLLLTAAARVAKGHDWPLHLQQLLCKECRKFRVCLAQHLKIDSS